MNTDLTAHLLAIAAEVMSVDEYVTLVKPQGAVRFQGHLLTDPAVAQAAITERLEPLGYTAALQHDDGRDVLYLLPFISNKPKQKPILALALLVATILSTLFVGDTMAQPDMASILRHPFSGWPFALSLIAILGVHEMGHYLVARHYGVQVSLPYFIPMPIGPFGTMGAFINMRSLPANRKHLFRIGIAGPLSGLVVAVGVILYGLATSPLASFGGGEAYYREGNSLLYLLLKYAVFKQWLPTGNLDVNLNPVAFAGWAGLLVTGLNLIPAAQLDGGHVAYALFGKKARWLTLTIAVIMIGLGFLWQGWFLWAAIILLLGSQRQVVQDEITVLNRSERLIAILVLVLFVLLFVPVPLLVITP